MRYVLVPVPTQYVLDVMRWVLFRTQDGDLELAKRDAEQLAAFLPGADETTRSLLHVVADATARFEHVRLRDLADDLGLDSEQVRDTVERLNRDVLGEGREILQVRNDPHVGLLGWVGTMAFVVMRPDLAAVVRSAGGSRRA